uniref:EGF-like domain-containing protein n=1 Tax=Acrobeloides nanus TaxID=290746 RepID=A0A914E7N2_9BILA
MVKFVLEIPSVSQTFVFVHLVMLHNMGSAVQLQQHLDIAPKTSTVAEAHIVIQFNSNADSKKKLSNSVSSKRLSRSSTCLKDLDCESECKSERCRCVYTAGTELGYCRNDPIELVSNIQTNSSESHVAIGPGSNCIRVGVRCANGSECVAGICTCPQNTKTVNGACVSQKTAYPGETCAQNEECLRNSFCNIETLRCECSDPTKLPIGRTCVDRLRSHPGFPCGNGELCTGNSICNQGTCTCPTNSILRNKVCVDAPKVNVGDSCGAGQICSDNSTQCDMRTKKCVCKPNFRLINGACRMMANSKPGESCTELGSHCIGNSFCFNGKCICRNGFKIIDGQCRKSQSSLPGSSCAHGETCLGLSECIDGKCTCVGRRVLYGNRCEIPKKVPIGQTCRHGDICMGASKCIQNTCQCGRDEVTDKGVCIRKTRGKIC